jgi:hypothetical protein
MSLDLFGETVEIILGTASLSAAPLGLLEVHRIPHYRAFQPSAGGEFELEEQHPCDLQENRTLLDM